MLQEFDLSSNEGVLLLCLAEALLRVPDADTIDELISDKLGAADWEKHISPRQALVRQRGDLDADVDRGRGAARG